jgi:thiamine biosynthesis lipoprotein
MRTALLIVIAALLPCPARAGTAERVRYLMGTTCTITADHASRAEAVAAIEAAFSEIARWESILSDYDGGSELSRLNASPKGEPFRCSEDLFRFLSQSLSLSSATAGAFDVTVGPLIDLYALRRGGRWPVAQEISGALRSTGSRLLRLDPAARTATFLEAGMRIDPGAIGKGTALDAAVRLLSNRGVVRAILDFGGQISVLGAGPGGCGVPVEIAAFGRSAPDRTIVYLADASASTSSNDERGLVVEGKPLGHILDPRSGRPAEGVTSVTVVAPAGEIADALSTALFVLGADESGARGGSDLSPEATEAARRFGAEAIVTSLEGTSRTTRSTPGFERLTHDRCAGIPPRTAPSTGASSSTFGGD